MLSVTLTMDTIAENNKSDQVARRKCKLLSGNEPQCETTGYGENEQ